MGNRLLVMLLLVLAIQANLLIIDKQDQDNSSPLWGFFSAPIGWSDTLILSVLGATLTAIAGGIIVGGIIFKNDLMVFSGIAAAILTWGATPIYSLWNIINREAVFGTSSWLVASIIVSPLGLMYIWYVISWWRGNSEI